MANHWAQAQAYAEKVVGCKCIVYKNVFKWNNAITIAAAD